MCRPEDSEDDDNYANESASAVFLHFPGMAQSVEPYCSGSDMQCKRKHPLAGNLDQKGEIESYKRTFYASRSVGRFSPCSG